MPGVLRQLALLAAKIVCAVVIVCIVEVRVRVDNLLVVATVGRLAQPTKYIVVLGSGELCEVDPIRVPTPAFRFGRAPIILLPIWAHPGLSRREGPGEPSDRVDTSPTSRRDTRVATRAPREEPLDA